MKRINGNGQVRLGLVMLLLALLIGSIAFAWQMSLMSAMDSNSMSYGLVDLTAELLMERDADWTAGFWHDAYNMMLRKLGHFCEYLLIGAISSLFFLTWFERMLQRWWGRHADKAIRLRRFATTLAAACVAFILSFMASFADEFYWQRLSQRHPRWFDVGVDMAGAMLGILLCVIVFSLGRWSAGEKRTVREIARGERE